MSLPTIYKGSDEVIQITITDGTNPIDLSTADDIFVYAYQTKEDIIQSWSLGEGDVTITNASNGICKVNLDRDNTMKIPEKRIYIEVDLQLVNASFEDGFSLEKDIKPLCDLLNSVS